MKIGLVRRGYSATGGAENYLCRLADALEAVGHDPVLFASQAWPRERWPAHRGFFLVEAGGPRAFADRLAALEPERRCDRLFSLERVWQCDCYRAGDGVHRAWLERRAAVEPAWRVRLRTWNPKHRQILTLEDALFGRSGATQVITNSRMVRDEILARHGSSPDRVQVVYNGLPAASFHPPTPGTRERTRETWGLQPDDYTMLFAGTGWERKGLAVALAAVARLPEVARPRLVIAGRGNPHLYLRRSPLGTRRRVHFLGGTPDMAACYAAADVFVAPTLYDPFSNACLEALAAGLPVLTTSANGFAEILTPGRDGEVMGPADADALTAALAAWANPARHHAARTLCAAAAAPFTIEANVARTLDILFGLSGGI